MIKLFVHASIIILFFVCILFSQDIYTTGLTLKKSNWNTISIQWRANVEKGFFEIYRNNKFPISSMVILSNSTNIFSKEISGISDSDLFKFSAIEDSDLLETNYYYAVLYKSTNRSNRDLILNLNYNYSPIVIKKDLKVISQHGIIKNLFFKTNYCTIFVFWNIDNPTENKNYQFSVYRTTNIITNDNQLKFIKPYKILKGEYYLEDSDIKYGIPYFYTVIVNDNSVIFPGTNQNINGIFIGSTNIKVNVEREIFIEKEMTKKEFESNFIE